MSFELPTLPYAKNALEPVISEKTIEFHYGKHHQAYVTNLNKLAQGSEFESADLETIIKKADGGIFNNGAQVWNHTFYFTAFQSPKENNAPSGTLNDAINEAFGSFEGFKKEFVNAAATQFGSGWAWLVKNSAGKLEIVKTGNADNPLKQGLIPLLTIDVWEHAYYLDYQNRRPDYIDAFWSIINWDVVAGRY